MEVIERTANMSCNLLHIFRLMNTPLFWKQTHFKSPRELKSSVLKFFKIHLASECDGIILAWHGMDR